MQQICSCETAAAVTKLWLAFLAYLTACVRFCGVDFVYGCLNCNVSVVLLLVAYHHKGLINCLTNQLTVIATHVHTQRR